MDKRPAENGMAPGSGIPWGKHGHLEKKKKKWKSSLGAYFRDLAIGRQEISRASAPVQPLGFSPETYNLQLPSLPSSTTIPVPQSCARDHPFPRLGKQADAGG